MCTLVDLAAQGKCGSCWAFAAAGSLEASASRREAYYEFLDYMDGHLPLLNDTDGFVKLQKQAIKHAQEVESRSFQMLNLSVQELSDCDTQADQGCTGGNPLLAFFFLHQYGLTSAHAYPYAGVNSPRCNKTAVRQPIASVRSWGVIPPNHENRMELALRFIGPISVGFNGYDLAFLSYKKGIFYDGNCKQGGNHALLIVGYGQKLGEFGDVQRYWIARNSWGKGWGEGGFVRISRRGGRKGVPGTCGIARNPSVALGGYLLDQQGMDSHSTGYGSVSRIAYTPAEKFCLFSGLRLDGVCGDFAAWQSAHRALILGILAVTLALLSIWPLSSEWRRRRRRKRMREEERRRKEENDGAINAENGQGKADHAEAGETSLLLSQQGGEYGTLAQL
jgi:hypothetical protein